MWPKSNISDLPTEDFKSLVDSKLILTPYVKSGEVWKARRLARVNPDPFLNVTSFSGYLTVNESLNSNLWFWFFPAESVGEFYQAESVYEEEGDEGSRTYENLLGRNLKDTPLILWLQGGPGSSSLFGLFTENGPFFVNEDQVTIRSEYRKMWQRGGQQVEVDQTNI